jgi:hypothetical protein
MKVIILALVLISNSEARADYCQADNETTTGYSCSDSNGLEWTNDGCSVTCNNGGTAVCVLAKLLPPATQGMCGSLIPAYCYCNGGN